MDINPDDFKTQNQDAQDATLLVRFYTKPKQDAAATAEAGRPIFRETEYIDIKVPGDRMTGVSRPARKRDIDRFPKHYQAFKERVAEPFAEGTPLVEWPRVTRSQVEELAFFNVKTVEQLVAMSDANAQKFSGINGLKRAAQEWLAQEGVKEAAKNLEAALAQRDKEIQELKALVAELKQPTESKPAPAKRRTRAVKKKPEG